MRLLSASLRRCWEREFKSLIVVIMIWNKLLRRSRLLRRNSISWRTSSITKEEKVQLTKTNCVNLRLSLLRNRKSYKMLKRLSWGEIVISEELRKRLRMKEERACLMSKRYVSLRSSLRLRLSKLANSMKSLLMSKIDMSFLLRKSKSLGRRWRRSEEQLWLRISMLLERSNKWKEIIVRSRKEKKEEKPNLIKLKLRHSSRQEKAENMNRHSTKSVEKAT